MKGHYIFSALLGIGLLLQGCETLDYTPADQLNDKTFWRTEQHAAGLSDATLLSI